MGCCEHGNGQLGNYLTSCRNIILLRRTPLHAVSQLLTAQQAAYPHTTQCITVLWTATIQSVAPTLHSVHCTFHCTVSVGTVKGCCTVHCVYEEYRLVRCDVTAVWHCAAGGCLCTAVPEYPSAITRTFAINSVIVVVMSHILSAIYWNSNESSGGTFGWNGGILLKIHSFYWSHT